MTARADAERVDWRALPAGNALDRLIAERLGYKVALIRVEGVPPELSPTGCEWQIVHPNGGEDFVGDEIEYGSEDEVWSRVFRTYEGCDSVLGRFSRDANAALTLPVEEGARIEVRYPVRGTCFSRVVISPSIRGLSTRGIDADPGYESSMLPAHAICLAWLAYQEKVKHE